MSQEPQPQQFMAMGAELVNVSKSLVDAKTIIWTNRFSCRDDPHPPEFIMKLNFGVRESGYFSCYFYSKSKRDLHIREVRVILCNDEMAILNDFKKVYAPTKLLESGGNFGFTKVHALRNVYSSDDEIQKWKIIYSLVYDGVLINGNFLDKCVCQNDQPSDMLALLESGTDSDITLRVGEEIFKAHKVILKTRSTHFQKMLDSGMKESLTNEIKLEDVDPAMVKEVLKFLYSGLPPENLPNFAMDLFPITDKYGIFPLREMCFDAIHGILSAENVVDALIMADLHSAQDLKDICAPVFKKNMTEIKRGKSWKRLSEHPRIVIPLLASFLD